MQKSVSVISSILSVSSSLVLKTCGLVLVGITVAWASQHKFQSLRSDMKAVPANQVTAAEKFAQLDCLTRNIYWEAAGEPFEGKVAVAQVTMNRLRDGRFGDNVCKVVHQRNVVYQSVVCQFTWTCQSAHRVKPINQAAWKESEIVAKKVMLENFKLPSLENALYFHADYVNPNWKKPRLVKIGKHIFYAEGQRT